MGGSNGKPRTCKGLFSRISYRLSQLEEARTQKGSLKVLQRTIPDIIAKDIDTADEVPSCSKGTLVDFKASPPPFFLSFWCLYDYCVFFFVIGRVLTRLARLD